MTRCSMPHRVSKKGILFVEPRRHTGLTRAARFLVLEDCAIVRLAALGARAQWSVHRPRTASGWPSRKEARASSALSRRRRGLVIRAPLGSSTSPWSASKGRTRRARLEVGGGVVGGRRRWAGGPLAAHDAGPAPACEALAPSGRAEEGHLEARGGRKLEATHRERHANTAAGARDPVLETNTHADLARVVGASTVIAGSLHKICALLGRSETWPWAPWPGRRGSAAHGLVLASTRRAAASGGSRLKLCWGEKPVC